MEVLLWLWGVGAAILNANFVRAKSTGLSGEPWFSEIALNLIWPITLLVVVIQAMREEPPSPR